MATVLKEHVAGVRVVRPPAELRGEVVVSGDKSITHRAVMLNAIARGAAVVTGAGLGGDCLSTAACMRALGATAGSVQRMVLRQGLVLAAIGLVIGVAVSLLAGGVIRSMLYGISPADPLTLLIVGGVLTAVSFVASYLPARRATRIDPAAALRSG